MTKKFVKTVASTESDSRLFIGISVLQINVFNCVGGGEPDTSKTCL